MANVKVLRDQLTQAAGSARVVVRCLNGGRDLQEPSQRAIMILVDALDTLHQLKYQLGRGKDKWVVEPSRLMALGEILDCFAATMKSMQVYFQPGGVGVNYYQKHLLKRTFLPRLEQYKVMLLLSMQPDSRLVWPGWTRMVSCVLTRHRFSVRLFLDEKIRMSLRLLQEVELGMFPGLRRLARSMS